MRIKMKTILLVIITLLMLNVQSKEKWADATIKANK